MRPVLLAVFLPLAACGGNDDEPAPAQPRTEASAETVEAPGPEQQPLPEIVSPLADAAPLTPGLYCYYRNDENVTEGLKITVSDAGAVSGDNYGIIHQRAADYFASFTTTLSSGTLNETAAVTFETMTNVDGETQSSSAIWYLSEEGAVPDGLDITLEPVACEGLEEKVQADGAP
jgi:hypothetical protein